MTFYAELSGDDVQSVTAAWRYLESLGCTDIKSYWQGEKFIVEGERKEAS